MAIVVEQHALRLGIAPARSWGVCAEGVLWGWWCSRSGTTAGSHGGASTPSTWARMQADQVREVPPLKMAPCSHHHIDERQSEPMHTAPLQHRTGVPPHTHTHLHDCANFLTSSTVGSRCVLYLALGCHRSYCACRFFPVGVGWGGVRLKGACSPSSCARRPKGEIARGWGERRGRQGQLGGKEHPVAGAAAGAPHQWSPAPLPAGWIAGPPSTPAVRRARS